MSLGRRKGRSLVLQLASGLVRFREMREALRYLLVFSHQDRRRGEPRRLCRSGPAAPHVVRDNNPRDTSNFSIINCALHCQSNIEVQNLRKSFQKIATSIYGQLHAFHRDVCGRPCSINKHDRNLHCATVLTSPPPSLHIPAPACARYSC